MGYEVLARKWRPRALEKVVGQEHILRMLTNALDHQRFHHAYLFTGTRGVGKTTLSRILAKCFNCDKGVTSKPCGICHICSAIDSASFPDLIEVDAASRTKVEDTRDLLDTLRYSPTQGRYKICLIDEIHMLSGHSFNALLKTLEEPPSHVIFLLATTDPEKLPLTVLSRCLQFHLHPLPVEKITQHLIFICESEKIIADPLALTEIAVAARGSVRDALSLLDQAIAYCDSNITLSDTEALLGSVPRDALLSLLKALADKNGQKLLAEINKLTVLLPDFDRLIEKLLLLLHEINKEQIIPSKEIRSAATDVGQADTLLSIAYFASHFSPTDIQLYYQMALIGRRDLVLAPTPALGFEMLMLRMLAFHPVIFAESNKDKGENKKISSKKTNPEITLHSPSPPLPSPQIIKQNSLASSNKTAILTGTQQNWTTLLTSLDLSGMAAALAAHCEMKIMTDTRIELVLAEKHASLLNKKLIERIQFALRDFLKKEIMLHITLTSNTIHTPAIHKQQAKIQQKKQAVTTLNTDLCVKKIIDTFDATFDTESAELIEPK